MLFRSLMDGGSNIVGGAVPVPGPRSAHPELNSGWVAFCELYGKAHGLSATGSSNTPACKRLYISMKRN